KDVAKKSEEQKQKIGKSVSTTVIGKNNPNWKGGVTRATSLQYHKEWKMKYPKKHKAHILARMFQAKIKKNNCEMCRNERSLEMHHPDYTQPLNVKTLCSKCHKSIHRQLKYSLLNQVR
ncbi:MAG: hypothetical protein AABY22_34260, partial [Nanoarchaeota archaeon]